MPVDRHGRDAGALGPAGRDPRPALTLARGRHAARLTANGDLVHESAFDVDWPKPPQVKGEMSPQSFARALDRLIAKEAALDDARLAEICGVEPQVLARMRVSFEGLDPRVGQEVLARLCHRFRLRPEELLDRFG